MKIKTMQARYRELRVLQTILLCASIISILIGFLPNTSFFSGLIFVFWWWFIPPSFDYLPFFWEGLLRKPRTLKLLYYVAFVFWVPVMMILTAIDYHFGLALTELILGTFSLTRAFVTSGIYAAIGFAIPLGKDLFDRLFRKVEVRVVWMYRKKVIALGHGEAIYMSDEDIKQGFPIHVRNNGRRSIAISNVIFEATTLPIPISFIKRNLARASHGGQYVEQNIPLKEIVTVDAGKSRVIHVPFDELEQGSAQVLRMMKKFRGRIIRAYIAVYDPFSQKEFRSAEILHLISKRQWPISSTKPKRKG